MKIFFTGSHGTGKTTSVYSEAAKLKLENPTKKIGILTENAAFSPYPINEKTTPESQLWIFTNQLQSELRLSTKYDIVVGDRTIVDAIAYTIVAGYFHLGKSMLQLATHHMCTYDQIYFKSIKSNDFLYNDGVRSSSNIEFRQNIESELLELYELLKKDCNFNFKII